MPQKRKVKKFVGSLRGMRSPDAKTRGNNMTREDMTREVEEFIRLNQTGRDADTQYQLRELLVDARLALQSSEAKLSEEQEKVVLAIKSLRETNSFLRSTNEQLEEIAKKLGLEKTESESLNYFFVPQK